MRNITKPIAKRISRVRNFFAVALICLTAWGGLVWWEDIIFYGRLYHAYRLGQQFYATYDGLVADIPFHPAMSPRLDVYSPLVEARGHGVATARNGFERAELLPVLVFVHGGLEDYATKALFAGVAMKVVPKNVVVVIPDYTLYPEADYHQMANEVAAAISWTLENINQYGGNPGQVVVAGHSSGAYLAVLAVLDEQFFKNYGHTPKELCGLISASGTYDVAAQYAFEQSESGDPEMFANLMRGPNNFAVASPLNYVRSDIPPLLLIHGDQDKTVPIRIAKLFYQKLQTAGVEGRLKIYEQRGHTDFLFEALSEEEPRVVNDFVEFMQDCG